MEIKLNEKYDFYGLVNEINVSTYDSYPVIVTLTDKTKTVVRLDKSEVVERGTIYHFIGTGVLFKNKIHILADTVKALDDEPLEDVYKLAVKNLFSFTMTVDLASCQKLIEDTINNLENEVIKNITSTIYNKYKEKFLVYPAATKFHHSYKNGLLLHTYNMLRLSFAYTEIYPNINNDLVYSGIILHDMMKTRELNDLSSEYTVEGKLIGHISLGAEEIVKVGAELGYSDTPEVLLLTHILLSHHEEPLYGSPKRPQIIEALIIHLCDMADAQIEPAIEGLERVKIGEFTDPIFTNNKEKFYKHPLSKE